VDAVTLAIAKKHTNSVALGQGAVQIPGPPGENNYQIAVKNGFAGTEQQYLASLKGKDGKGVPNGGSADQVLTKVSEADFDTKWDDAKGVGADIQSIINAEIQSMTNAEIQNILNNL
jgi:hypothetical protein